MNTFVTPETDRVRRHTSCASTRRIDAQTRQQVREHAAQGPSHLDERITTLETEWDVERTLETNAGTLALTGAVLGLTVDRRWFWLTGGVLTFLLQHAVSGWCPPLPVLRRLGVRTQGEIDREKFALKAVRGDFATNTDDAGQASATHALRAVASDRGASRPAPRREPDRVRRYTSRSHQQRIDVRLAHNVRRYAGQSAAAISERIAELQREWSIERYLQVNVAIVGLTSATLAATSDRRWGLVTCAGLAFFLFHAVEGFDPPLPLLRRAGVRSRAEIDREIYALKFLRGDFDRVYAFDDRVDRAEAALEAVEPETSAPAGGHSAPALARS